MLPMVNGVDEVRAVRRALERLGPERAGEVKLGVMIETPAAALLAAQLAAETDFFSVGTNDLAQYALAIDRGDARLAGEADALHPAVLRLIGMTVEGALAAGRPVSVCGGLGADPLALPLLLGLGVGGVSVPPPRVAAVKARIGELSRDACRALATAALGLSDADSVRRLVRDQAPEGAAS
jgi:phosphocarrier protein FPr/phosphocarrier protein